MDGNESHVAAPFKGSRRRHSLARKFSAHSTGKCEIVLDWDACQEVIAPSRLGKEILSQIFGGLGIESFPQHKSMEKPWL